MSSFLGRPRYRARQFFGALNPVVRRAELREAASTLGMRLMPLFSSMSERDQRHCLDVYEVLREAGCEDNDVLTAALLHDTGKGSLAGTRIQLWHRVAFVVLENGPEPLMLRASGLSQGIDVLRTHGERGVELAEEFGASPEVVRLLRAIEGMEAGDERVAMLRAADERV